MKGNGDMSGRAWMENWNIQVSQAWLGDSSVYV